MKNKWKWNIWHWSGRKRTWNVSIADSLLSSWRCFCLSLFFWHAYLHTHLFLSLYLSLSRSQTNGQNVSISIEVVVIITFDTNSAAAANEWPTSGRTLSSKIHSKRLEKSLSRFLKGKIFCRVVMNSVLSFFCRPRLGLHKSQFLAGDNPICSPIAR